MINEKISISYNHLWEITGYALVGSIEGGLTVQGYPENFEDDFKPGVFKYDSYKKAIVLNPNYVEPDIEEEKPEPEVIKEMLAEQAMLLTEQQSTIQMQSAMIDMLMEQIATLGLVVVPTKKASDV